VAAYAAGWAVRTAIATAAALPALPSVLLAGAAYAAAYAALARWWGVAPDPRPALRRAWRRIASRAARSEAEAG
jgi:hypothetical protein